MDNCIKNNKVTNLAEVLSCEFNSTLESIHSLMLNSFMDLTLGNENYNKQWQ